MDLTTELLDTAAFREAKRGGYNTQDVDEFIEQVKAEYQQHGALVASARRDAEGLQARVAEAERSAAEAAQRATVTSDADETLKRTLVLAQRTADAAIKEAEEQAARTLSSAQDQAARMLADAQEATARARADAEHEARRAQEEARGRVLAELRDLEAARDHLHGDVDSLERHLEEQRARVRLTAQELQRLLDDPSTLLAVDAPEMSEIVVPTPAPAARVEPLVAAPPSEPEAEAPSAWMPEDEAWSDPEEAVAPPPSAAYAAPEPVATDVEGPRTQPVDALAERDPGDDAYLAELRKAMTDESPLGPREDGDDSALFDDSSEPSRSRFGRRR